MWSDFPTLWRNSGKFIEAYGNYLWRGSCGWIGELEEELKGGQRTLKGLSTQIGGDHNVLLKDKMNANSLRLPEQLVVKLHKIPKKNTVNRNWKSRTMKWENTTQLQQRVFPRKLKAATGKIESQKKGWDDSSCYWQLWKIKEDLIAEISWTNKLMNFVVVFCLVRCGFEVGWRRKRNLIIRLNIFKSNQTWTQQKTYFQDKQHLCKSAKFRKLTTKRTPDWVLDAVWKYCWGRCGGTVKAGYSRRKDNQAPEGGKIRVRISEIEQLTSQIR